MAGKIDKDGNYKPFCGYSIISMCEIIPKLKELHDVFQMSPIAKYYKPLKYETYHVTVFNIWHENEQFYPYQLDELGAEPKRDTNSMNNVMKLPLLKFRQKFRELSELDSVELSGLTLFRNPAKSSIRCDVVITNQNQLEQLKKVRSWCADKYDKSDSDLKFHITLGYKFKEIKEDLEPACNELQEWINCNIPKTIISKPTPMMFHSMENFIPYPEPLGKDHSC